MSYKGYLSTFILEPGSGFGIRIQNLDTDPDPQSH
jgi:hypothetical protein